MKLARALVALGCAVGLFGGTPAYSLEKYGRALPSLETEKETQKNRKKKKRC
jgi:hypothetical protein